MKESLNEDLWQSLKQSEGWKHLFPILKSNHVFRRTYRDDPLAFIHDCLHWEKEKPAPYQEETLAALPVKKRICERGPHGLGKTAIAAWAVHWFALTRDGEDWKLPTTASAWRQLTKFLWPEIHKWARKIIWSKVGREPYDERKELLNLSLKLSTGEAFAIASHDASLIEGAHADSIFYIFDESKSIPDETFDAVEGAFSTAGSDTAGEAFALAISTPGEPLGRFFDIQTRRPGFEDWWVKQVTLKEAIAAGRISEQWAQQRKRQWGENSSIYQNRVLGEFAQVDEDALIPLAWIEAAYERWEEWNEAGRPGKLEAVGADIARSGADQSVFALRYGASVIGELRTFSKADTMQTVGRLSGILQHNRQAKALIDVIGVGAGVYDRLKEGGFDVYPFNAAERSFAKDASGELGFTNKRSHGWWHLRELLDPQYAHEIALPLDDELTGDLIAQRLERIHSTGKIQVMSKEKIKKALGRSTDKGDAVMQALYPVGKKILGGVNVW